MTDDRAPFWDEKCVEEWCDTTCWRERNGREIEFRQSVHGYESNGVEFDGERLCTCPHHKEE